VTTAALASLRSAVAALAPTDRARHTAEALVVALESSSRRTAAACLTRLKRTAARRIEDKAPSAAALRAVVAAAEALNLPQPGASRAIARRAAIEHAPRFRLRYYTDWARRFDRALDTYRAALAVVDVDERDREDNFTLPRAHSFHDFLAWMDHLRLSEKARELPSMGEHLSIAQLREYAVSDLDRALEGAERYVKRMEREVEDHRDFWVDMSDRVIYPKEVKAVETMVEQAREVVKLIKEKKVRTRALRFYRDEGFNNVQPGVTRPEHEDVEVLYHASVNARQLVEEGFSAEVPKSGASLGGAQDTHDTKTPGIACTSDIYVAKEIARWFKIVTLVAQGKFRKADVVELAARHKIKGVSAREVERIRDRPDDVFELLKTTLAHGHFEKKIFDPLFFAISIESFKNVDLDQIGVVAMKVDMTDRRIMFLSSMSEFRVPVSAILSIEGFIGERSGVQPAAKPVRTAARRVAQLRRARRIAQREAAKRAAFITRTYPSLTPDDVQAILAADPTPHKAYALWLAKQKATRGVAPASYTDDLNRFEDYKRRRLITGREADIGRLNDAAFNRVLEQAEARLVERDAATRDAVRWAQQERRERLRQQAREIVQSGRWPAGTTRDLGTLAVEGGQISVTEVLDRDAMVNACAKHASGTWCVGYAHTPAHWDDYKSRGGRFFVLDGQVNGAPLVKGPWLLFAGTDALEVKNNEDKEVAERQWRVLLPALADYLGIVLPGVELAGDDEQEHLAELRHVFLHDVGERTTLTKYGVSIYQSYIPGTIYTTLLVGAANTEVTPAAQIWDEYLEAAVAAGEEVSARGAGAAYTQMLEARGFLRAPEVEMKVEGLVLWYQLKQKAQGDTGLDHRINVTLDLAGSAFDSRYDQSDIRENLVPSLLYESVGPDSLRALVEQNYVSLASLKTMFKEALDRLTEGTPRHLLPTTLPKSDAALFLKFVESVQDIHPSVLSEVEQFVERIGHLPDKVAATALRAREGDGFTAEFTPEGASLYRTLWKSIADEFDSEPAYRVFAFRQAIAVCEKTLDIEYFMLPALRIAHEFLRKTFHVFLSDTQIAPLYQTQLAQLRARIRDALARYDGNDTNRTAALTPEAIARRVEFLRKTFPALSEDAVNAVMLADPTENKEFVTWLAKRVLAGERADHYTEDLSSFAEYKRRRLFQGTEGDIGRLDGAGLRQLLDTAEERLAARDASQAATLAAARARREERMRAQAEQIRREAPKGHAKQLGQVSFETEVKGGSTAEITVTVTEIFDREAMVDACARFADGNWCVGYAHTDAHWNDYYSSGRGRFFLLDLSTEADVPELYSPWLLFVNKEAAQWEVKDNHDDTPEDRNLWVALTEALQASPLGAQMDVADFDFSVDERDGDAEDEHETEQRATFEAFINKEQTSKYEIWRIGGGLYWSSAHTSLNADVLWDEYMSGQPDTTDADDALKFTEEKLESLHFKFLGVWTLDLAQRVFDWLDDKALDYLSTLDQAALAALEDDFSQLEGALENSYYFRENGKPVQNVAFVSEVLKKGEWPAVLHAELPVFEPAAVEAYLTEGQAPSFKNMKLAQTLLNRTEHSKLIDLVIQTLRTGTAPLSAKGTQPLEELGRFVRYAFESQKSTAKVGDLCRAAIAAAQGQSIDIVRSNARTQDWLLKVAETLRQHLGQSAYRAAAVPAAEAIVAEMERIGQILRVRWNGDFAVDSLKEALEEAKRRL
jgi:hypothetical protein